MASAAIRPERATAMTLAPPTGAPLAALVTLPRIAKAADGGVGGAVAAGVTVDGPTVGATNGVAVTVGVGGGKGVGDPATLSTGVTAASGDSATRGASAGVVLG